MLVHFQIVDDSGQLFLTPLRDAPAAKIVRERENQQAVTHYQQARQLQKS